MVVAGVVTGFVVVEVAAVVGIVVAADGGVVVLGLQAPSITASNIIATKIPIAFFFIFTSLV